MQQYQFAGNNRTAWDSLSMKEKAEMMRVAVRNGITNLSEIRQKYNEFAEGGNLYAGTSTDNDLVDWIIKEEGFLSKPEDIGDGVMTVGSGLTAKKWHDLYKARGNKWSAEDNRRAVAEEVASRRRWAEKNVPNWDTLPESSQKALLSYKYNYNFTKANSPKLFKALEDSNLYEAARQMDATSKNPKFRKGLQARRQREQEWFLKDVTEEAPKFMPPREYYHPTVSTAVYNPYVEQATVIPTFYEDEITEPVQETPTERRMRDIQDVMRAYERFDALTKLLNIRSNPIPFVHPKSIIPILSDFGLIQGDEYKHGGKIHIAPSKRGTFTAAAKKHGMGVQEFASRVLANKENYSPAMVKKANFARNASKWHGLGGNLYDGTTEDSQQMNIMAYNPEEDYWTGPASRFGITVTKKKRKGLLDHIFDIPTMVQASPGSATSYATTGQYMPRVESTVGKELGQAAVTVAAPFIPSAALAVGTPGSAFWTNPITQQIMTGTAMSEGVNLANKAVTGYNTVGEGVGDVVEQYTGWNPNNTLLGPLVTEAFNPGWYWSPNSVMGAVGRAGNAVEKGAEKFSTLYNSPLTGNWTKIGNREYRLSPNSLGANGSSLESRAISPQITAENAASMTPEQWTAAQDAAIVRGDIAEAQRLRDLHAKVKGYNSSLSLYHGSPEKNITAFDPNAKAGTLEGSGGTTFFTPNFEAADTYAKGKGVLEMTHDPGKVYKVYSAHKNPKIIDYDGASYLGTGTKLTMNAGDGIMRRILNPKGGGHFLDDYIVYTYDKLPIEGLKYPRYYAPPRNKHIVWEKEKVAGSTSEEAAKAMSEGYDVAILKNVDEGVGPNNAKIGPIDDYAIRNPQLIKSADAVTYDDNGVRIPLGERDNFKLNDIRYARDPSSYQAPYVNNGRQGLSTIDFTDFDTMVERMNSAVEYSGKNPFGDGKMTGFRKWALDNGASPADIVKAEKEFSGNNWAKLRREFSLTKDSTRPSAYIPATDKVVMNLTESDFNQIFPHEVEHRLFYKLFGNNRNSVSASDISAAFAPNSSITKVMDEFGEPYYFKNNYEELLNRLTQIKNALGIKEARALTAKELKEAYRLFRNGSIKFADNLSDFFDSIKSWEAAAKLSGKALTTTGIGYSALNSEER